MKNGLGTEGYFHRRYKQMEPQKEAKQASKHTLIMVLCCLVPMLLVVLFIRAGIGGALSFLVILLCPLMHIFLMRGMHGKHAHNGKHLHNGHADHYVINTETNAQRESNFQSDLLRRLASDHPAIAEDLEAGKFTSVRQAAIAAGIVKEDEQEEAGGGRV
jgi:hypothetical protein